MVPHIDEIQLHNVSSDRAHEVDIAMHTV